MAKKEYELMSKRAYADYLGVSDKAIRNAINEGKIKKGWDTQNEKIIKHLADKEYGFLHKQPKAGHGISQMKIAAKLTSDKTTAKLAKSRTSNPQNADISPQNEKSADLYQKPNKKELEEKFEDMFEGSTMTVTQIIKKINIHPDLTYNEAMRRKIILELCSDFMKIEKEQGELVRKSDIDKALYAFGAIIKRALLNIPNRVMDNLRAADTKVEAMNLLRDEINNILTSVSKHQNLKIGND